MESNQLVGRRRRLGGSIALDTGGGVCLGKFGGPRAMSSMGDRSIRRHAFSEDDSGPLVTDRLKEPSRFALTIN